MSPAQVRHLHRAILWSAGLVLAAAVALVLLPSPEQSEADTRTRRGTVTQTTTYVGTKPEERRECLSYDWYGQCEKWRVRTVQVPCTPGADPACSNILTQTRLACSGFWAGGPGSNCREYVPHSQTQTCPDGSVIAHTATCPTTTTGAPTTTEGTTTTSTYSPTTITTTPPSPPRDRCTGNLHYHPGPGGGCFAPHQVPTCGGYYVHSGHTHVWVEGTPCNPEPDPDPDPDPDPVTCAGGTHRFGSGCHPDHPPRPACSTAAQTYTYHSGGSHVTGTVAPCPTTTTTQTPSTTAVPLVCSSGLSPVQEQELRDLVGDLVGWGTSFPNDGSVGAVWAGDEPPQAGGSFWFIASDKISSPSSAEPPVWPVADGAATAAAVEDDGGCWWYPVKTWSRWNSLKPWSYAERLKIGSVAPDWVDRWNLMSSAEQQETRDRWEALEKAHPDPSRWCDVDEADPEGECAFFVPYTAVWEWSLYARVETTDDGGLSRDVVRLHSGVSMVRRLVDYSDWERTTTGFGGDE